LLDQETIDKLKVLGTDQSPEPIIFGNFPEQMVVYANAAALKLFGYKEEELLGKPLSVFIPPESMGQNTADECDRVHRKFVEKFVQGSEMREFGQERELMAWDSGSKRFPVGLKVFKCLIDGEFYIGEVVRDRTMEIQIRKELADKTVELEQQAEELLDAKRDAEIEYLKQRANQKKSQTMLLVVYFLGGMSIYTFCLPMVISVFRRVPQEFFSLSRDATMLLISTLGAVIGYMFGQGQRKEEPMEIRSESNGNISAKSQAKK